MQLITVMFTAVNFHQVCDELNRLGVAEHVIQLNSTSDGVLVVLRASDDAAPALRALLGYSTPANLPRYDLSIDRRWVPFAGTQI